LATFIITDPVMLLVVEHRDEHVEMVEKFGQSLGGVDFHGEEGRRPPVGEAAVERVGGDGKLVPEGFEESLEKVFAAAARQGSDARGERNGHRDQFGPGLADAGEGSTKHLRDGDREHRRGDVGSVIDVLVEGALAALSPDEGNRVDIEKQGGGAAGVGCLGVENVGVPKGKGERLHLGGVLVQKIAQV
jgi:hypothetical protein